jgi:general secretion pathway protein C
MPVNLAPTAWADTMLRLATQPTSARVASALLAFVVGWQFGALAWRLVPAAPASEPPPAQRAVGGSSDGTRGAAQTAASKLASLHLFGRSEGGPGQSEQAQQEVAADAPETQLNLTLKGVYAPGSGGGVAIITAGGGAEKVYAVGDTVKGDARVARILANRVILQRNGRAETLRMAGADKEPPAASGNDRSASTPSNVDAIGQRAQQLRREILNDPGKLGRLVRFEPHVDEGELVGYKIRPREADAKLLKELGLEPSDTITRVNGEPLNDPRKANAVLRNLRDAARIRVTLMRDGQRRTIEVPLQSSQR